MYTYDATIIGSGVNGLAAAIMLAQHGWRVLLLEEQDRIGGAAASAALTLPGYVHDLGSAVHPLGVGSPFLRTLPLAQHGLRWIHPAVPLAHPLDNAPAVLLERSIGNTARGLGRDGAAYQALMTPVVRRWHAAMAWALGPLRPPRDLWSALPFAIRAPWPLTLLTRVLFREQRAPALLAGLGAHATLPLSSPVAGAIALVLGSAGHAVGWPVPQGGAQALADALASYLRTLGGEIRTGVRVDTLDDLPARRAVLCDLPPRELLRIAGERFPAVYQAQLAGYRHGPGVCKVDWALDAPIPWEDPAVLRAATVHLGGTFAEIARAEAAPERGIHDPQPYVLLAQPTLFDPTRAPPGRHTAWAYCHVPHGSAVDMTAAIEAQIERFAPGFRSHILARHTTRATEMTSWNRNLIGGDIAGGRTGLRQLFTRPTLSLTPYRTPLRGLYLCSSSTPPGAGAHGMCGFHAAQTVLRDMG